MNVIGTVSQKFFCFRFCHESSCPKPLKKTLGSFQIFSKILGDIRKLRCTTDVNHTDSKFATGINDTGGKFCHGTNSVVDTSNKFASSVNDTSGKFATGVVDNSGK
jgi:hypothetical protein